jgi:hypothetical protein
MFPSVKTDSWFMTADWGSSAMAVMGFGGVNYAKPVDSVVRFSANGHNSRFQGGIAPLGAAAAWSRVMHASRTNVEDMVRELAFPPSRAVMHGRKGARGKGRSSLGI